MPSIALLERYAPLAPVAGCPRIVAHQALDVFALWLALEDEAGTEQDVPFWGTIWPASAVLARSILTGEIDVSGRCVLDLGCGAGVAAIASAMAGAKSTIANDIDQGALFVARRNAEANGVKLRTDPSDFTDGDALPGADIILVADMFYEKAHAHGLLDMLVRARASHSRVVIADAQRTFAPRSGVCLLSTATIAVDAEVEGAPEREVRLLELPHSRATGNQMLPPCLSADQCEHPPSG